MYNDYDDFYYEPSEFEQMVDEFKASLRANVKDEIKEELAQLRKENEANRELRNNWNAKVAELEKEYQNKKYELTKAIRAAEDEARKAKQTRLKELISEWPVVAYTIETEYIKREKCDLCDSQRRRKYTTPLGREAYEYCTCSEQRKRYHTKKAPIFELQQMCNDSLQARYLVNKNAAESFMRYSEKFFDDEPFEKINPYGALFRDENRAKRYAAWLNKREEQKEKMDGGAEDG